MNSGVVRTCERIGAGLGGLAILVSLATGQPWGMTLGVGLGALVALANFVAIRVLVGKALSGKERNAKGAAMLSLLFGLKLMAVVAFVWVAIRFWGADTTGFLFGVTAVFVSVIMVSLLGASAGNLAPERDQASLGTATPEGISSASPPESLPLTATSAASGAVVTQDEFRG